MEQYADLIANQGLLADIYNKQRKEYMTAKNREEKRREKEKRRQRKLITIIKKIEMNSDVYRKDTIVTEQH